MVPVYNAARTIRPTVEALLALEGPDGPPELILVDDGSTDGTADALAGYPVRVAGRPNGGPAAARNTGWRASSGDVVLFTDADCIPPPGWVKGMLGAFADPLVGAAGGGYDIANPKSRLSRLIHAEILRRHAGMPSRVKALGSYNLAVRRDVLDRVGGFDESFATSSGEDNDLSYRVRAAGFQLAFDPSCTVAHRHPERVRPYLRTQFVHGYWRSHLYRRHAAYMKGDDYTGFGDALDVLLAALTLGSAGAALLLAPFAPRLALPAGLAAAVSLAALLAVSGVTAFRLARRAKDRSLFPFGAAVLAARAFSRIAGWLLGALRIPLPGRAFRRQR